MNPKNRTLKYPVPALEKGLDILEKLAQASTPLTLTHLAQQLGRTSSEIYRMLSTLEARGYIVREEHSGSYTLSLRLYELAHTHSPVEKLIRAARQPMEGLALELDESVHLSVLSHGALVVLWQALNQGPIQLSVEVGGRFSCLHTASGRLLLAHLPPEELRGLLDEIPDYQAMTAGERAAVERRLEEIREKGYSFAENETRVGIRDYAVLVGNPKVGLAAALTITSLPEAKGTNGPEKILAALQNCAATITRNVGIC